MGSMFRPPAHGNDLSSLRKRSMFKLMKLQRDCSIKSPYKRSNSSIASLDNWSLVIRNSVMCWGEILAMWVKLQLDAECCTKSQQVLKTNKQNKSYYHQQKQTKNCISFISRLWHINCKKIKIKIVMLFNVHHCLALFSLLCWKKRFVSI